MGYTDKKETLKFYELATILRNDLYVYINTGGLVEELDDKYTQDTKWIIKGSNSKFDGTISSLEEQEINGNFRPVKHDFLGQPYIEEGDGSKWYIRQNDEEISDSTVPIFTFKVNPTHINLNKRKLITKLRTKGGFVFQYWGPDITEISVEGTTGNILPRGVKFRKTNIPLLGEIPLPRDISQEAPTIENSPLYDIFRKFENLYNADQGKEASEYGKILAMEYRNKIYVGHLSEFSFEERGDRPFQFYYRFTFQVHYETTDLGSAHQRIEGYLRRNEETLNLLKDIKRKDTSESDISI